MVMRTIYPKGISLRDRRLMNLRRYKQRHPDRVKFSNERWAKNNKERIKNYAIINKEKYKIYKHQYYMDRKEKIRQRVIGRKMRIYGSNIETYNNLYKLQDGRCAICKQFNSSKRHGKYLFIDHCHQTNLFRGLICGNCNTMLGYANDNIEILKAGIRYLQGFKGREEDNYKLVS